MLQQLQHHINQHFSFIKEKKILVALSGGVDSIVLSYLLHQLGFDIAVAHCNFKLRGDQADADQNFCKQWAENLQIPFHTIDFDTQNYADTQHLSIQMAARELRYDWFSSLVTTHSYDFLVTAHHANDALETFLINLSRGSGLKGLLGIPFHNQAVIRPLLIFTKEEIIQFAQENHLQWREDQSNTKDAYLRNHIRLHVIPELEKSEPHLLQNFQKTLQYLSDNEKIVEDSVALTRQEVIVRKSENEVIFSVEKLQNLKPLDTYLHYIFEEYGFHNILDLKRLLQSETGKFLKNEHFQLIKSQNQLFLVKTQPNPAETTFEIPIFAGNELDLKKYITQDIFESIRYEENTIEVEQTQLIFPLQIRQWEASDSFQPSGMKGKKKVSKFLKDCKIPVPHRKDIYILVNGNQEIMAVLGFRVDERYKVKTKAVTIIF